MVDWARLSENCNAYLHPNWDMDGAKQANKFSSRFRLAFRSSQGRRATGKVVSWVATIGIAPAVAWGLRWLANRQIQKGSGSGANVQQRLQSASRRTSVEHSTTDSYASAHSSTTSSSRTATGQKDPNKDVSAQPDVADLDLNALQDETSSSSSSSTTSTGGLGGDDGLNDLVDGDLTQVNLIVPHTDVSDTLSSSVNPVQAFWKYLVAKHLGDFSETGDTQGGYELPVGSLNDEQKKALAQSLVEAASDEDDPYGFWKDALQGEINDLDGIMEEGILDLMNLFEDLQNSIAALKPLEQGDLSTIADGDKDLSESSSSTSTSSSDQSSSSTTAAQLQKMQSMTDPADFQSEVKKLVQQGALGQNDDGTIVAGDDGRYNKDLIDYINKRLAQIRNELSSASDRSGSSERASGLVAIDPKWSSDEKMAVYIRMHILETYGGRAHAYTREENQKIWGDVLDKYWATLNDKSKASSAKKIADLLREKESLSGQTAQGLRTLVDGGSSSRFKQQKEVLDAVRKEL